MNWQCEHEHLLDEISKIAGRKVSNFYEDTAHLSGEKLEQVKFLNELNRIAVENYYKE